MSKPIQGMTVQEILDLGGDVTISCFFLKTKKDAEKILRNFKGLSRPEYHTGTRADWIIKQRGDIEVIAYYNHKI